MWEILSGYAFGIDLLFWAWAIVTVIAFLDLFIPDPIPMVDEIFLITLSGILLVALAVRGTVTFFADIWGYVTHPLPLTFVLTLLTFIVINRIMKKTKKVKKK